MRRTETALKAWEGKEVSQRERIDFIDMPTGYFGRSRIF